MGKPRGAGADAAGGPDADRRVHVATMDPIRDAVVKYIAFQAKRYPVLDLKPFRSEGMSGRDAAFAHAIGDAVLRRWPTLVFLLSRHLQQHWDNLQGELRGVLLTGAAQILFMDRVPSHAAINHAVEWAKLNIRAGAGGMTNAILRKIADLRAAEPRSAEPAPPGESAGDAAAAAAAAPAPARETSRAAWTNRPDEIPLSSGAALVIGPGVLPEGEWERAAVVTGVPAALLAAWRSSYGDERAFALARHALTAPPVILHTAFAEPTTLPRADLLAPHADPGHHVFVGPYGELVSLLEGRTDLWAQDPASSGAVRSIADLRPKLVVDLCAGQGTKTRQLAATFRDARIVASDPEERRQRTLAAAHQEDRQVKVVADAEVTPGIGADLVLLDVPCSNTGVLARRPEAKYRYTAKAVAELIDLQRSILRRAAALLAPGGSILYATCSLDPRENAEQAAWAAAELGLAASRQREELPAGGPGEAAAGYHDGAYSVLLTAR